MPGSWRVARRAGRRERSLNDADAEQQHHVDDEEVGRDGEDLARLLHAAQVAERDEHDEDDRRSAAMYGASAGNADASAAVPAATDTATVRM